MIETERLFLRNYTLNDLEDYWEYVQMPNVGPRCGWPAYTDKEKAKERLKIESSKPLQYAIELKDTHKVVGSIELMEPDENTKTDGKTNEIGCLLHEGYWGKGIMTEAMQAIVKYGMDELGLDGIVASYYTPNVASGKIQLKAGLKPYKIIKDMIVWYETGKPCDGVVCKITRQEYLDNPTYKNLQIKVKDTKLGIDKEKAL